MSKLLIFSYIFENSLRDEGHFLRLRAIFWGLAGHFWPAGHGLGTAELELAKMVIVLRLEVI